MQWLLFQYKMFICFFWFHRKYSELHIYRATLADAGEYVCRVSSKLGNDSTKASVIITDTNGKAWLIILLSHSERPHIKAASRTSGLGAGQSLASEVEVEALESIRCTKKSSRAWLVCYVVEMLGFPYRQMGCLLQISGQISIFCVTQSLGHSLNSQDQKKMKGREYYSNSCYTHWRKLHLT